MARDRQKSYTNKCEVAREFRVRKHVYLKVMLKKTSFKLEMCPKLELSYCGSFENLVRIGHVAYEIALPPYIKVHNVFHVLLFKNDIPDPNHIINWVVIQVETERDIPMHPMHILISYVARDHSHRESKGPMDALRP